MQNNPPIGEQNQNEGEHSLEPKSSFSPLPKEQRQATMSFYEALQKVVEREKITKLEWGDKSIYGFLDGNVLKLKQPDKLDNWLLTLGDLAGEDWVIL